MSAGGCFRGILMTVGALVIVGILIFLLWLTWNIWCFGPLCGEPALPTPSAEQSPETDSQSEIVKRYYLNLYEDGTLELDGNAIDAEALKQRIEAFDRDSEVTMRRIGAVTVAFSESIEGILQDAGVQYEKVD